MGIFDYFTGEGYKNAANIQQQSALTGLSKYTDAANAAANYSKDYGGQAVGTWQDLLNSANAGGTSYADAVGINGPEGIARARSAFAGITQPSIDMALDAMTRQQRAQGVGTGNVLAGETQYATNEMNKRYNDYVAMLNPYLQQQTQATAGTAGAQTGLGNTLAGIEQGIGNQSVNAYNTYGQAGAQGALASTMGMANTVNTALQVGKLVASGMTGGLSGLATNLMGSPGGYDPSNPGAGAPRAPTGLFSLMGSG